MTIVNEEMLCIGPCIICESLLMQLGPGIEWLCTWNISTFYLLSALFVVVVFVTLTYKPKRVSLFCLSRHGDLIYRNSDFWNFFYNTTYKIF